MKVLINTQCLSNNMTKKDEFWNNCGTKHGHDYGAKFLLESLIKMCYSVAVTIIKDSGHIPSQFQIIVSPVIRKTGNCSKFLLLIHI